MAFTGIPRELADWVNSMQLSPMALIAVLTVVYLILGTALDGISMIVLTSAVVLPMIQKSGFDLIWRAASIPSISGIITSMMIKCG